MHACCMAMMDEWPLPRHGMGEEWEREREVEVEGEAGE